METIYLSIHRDDLERIDRLISDGVVKNRSDFIRNLIDAPGGKPRKSKKRVAVTVEPEQKEKLLRIAREHKKMSGNFQSEICCEFAVSLRRTYNEIAVICCDFVRGGIFVLSS